MDAPVRPGHTVLLTVLIATKSSATWPSAHADRLLRCILLSVVYPLTIGLAVIGVQVAMMLFHKTIMPTQWLGTPLITLGVVLVCKSR